MVDVQIFRVIVRGRFGALDAARRASLLADADRHDALVAARFSAAGTLSYDRRIDFFSFRIEVRVEEEEAPDEARELAFERAIALATADLERRGVTGRDLRATGSNMADVWH
jgi:hypothetical protein